MATMTYEQRKKLDAKLKRRARKSIAYNPRHTDQSARGYRYHTHEHMRFVENADNGLRLAGYADEIEGARIEHRGWFTDEYCDGVMRGVVYRLPHGRFAYGYADPNNDGCAYLCFDLDADDEAEAARYADRIAEIHAEQERAYQAKWQAAREIEDIRADIANARAEHSQLVRALRAGIGDDATGARMREHVRERVTKAKDKIAALIREHGAEILTSEFN
jgi:hypothetical protein